MMGLNGGSVRLVAYDVNWPIEYAAEAARLRSALGPLALDIQHIGSTAVPGLAAKPVLDIAIAVSSAAADCASLIESLGYVYRLEVVWPRPGHHYFVRDNPRTHQIHLWEVPNPGWDDHLRFRDLLRANPALVREYSTLKTELALRFADDRIAYANAKDDFVHRVLTG